MSLSVLGPLPDWRQKAESLQRELFERNRQLADAEDALRLERGKNATIERGVSELRTVLSPLYQGLAHIFGEIDAMGVGESSAPSATPQKSAVWESWKQKLGPMPSKAIDALLMHGGLTQTQLRIHVGCAAGSMSDLVYRLNKAGIINKNGGKISLKEL